MRWLTLFLACFLAACGSPELVIEIGFDVPADTTQQIKQLRVNITAENGDSLLQDELLPATQQDPLIPPVELAIRLSGVSAGAPINVLAEGLVGDQIIARALVSIPAVKQKDRLAISLLPVRCGDGVVDTNEECDDGNTNNADDCEADCTTPRCGNLIIDQGEDCDDGNQTPNDGCGNDCLFDFPPSCGDGNAVFPEECDNGNLNSDTTPDACRTNCLQPRCGDSVSDSGESCDDGSANSLLGPCLPNCSLADCGDGVFQPSLNEECDDANQIDGDGCSSLCQIEPPPGCGDGAVVSPEECDDGNLNSDTTPGACRSNCLQPRCGDGVTDQGESCDDAGGNSLIGPCLPDCTSARCGDGIFQPNRLEECDDANTNNNDGCDSACEIEIPPSCGDGIVQTPEQCDDGLLNANVPNACRVSCEDPRCGDGLLDQGEQCDDAGGNSLSGPCLLDCSFARCGDGVFDASRGEECDDGNELNLDGCSAFCEIEPPPNCGDLILNANEECDNGVANSNNTPNACRESCLLPRCGDSVIDNNESCDDGIGNALAGPCLPDCSFARCGDGVFQPSRGEDCDDGNNINDDGCDSLCQSEAPPSCGDGQINSSAEQCDNGAGNSNTISNACRQNCTNARCGDGVIDSGEVCDNGGTNSLSGPCLPTCQLARCGDGVFQPNRNEECDDANTNNNDGCDGACQFEIILSCGNGSLESPEECDNGNLNSDSASNACRTNCTNHRCGDGATDTGEQCDNGGGNSLLGPCLPTCQNAGCGDGILQQNRGEQCDDGNNASNDGCAPNCSFEVPAGCGDGTVQGNEQCDNGPNNSNVLSNACRTNCTLPRCGDAVIDAQETCDDGALNAFAGPCLPTCQLAACGDGVLQINRGEACDDGDLDAGDGCNSQCQIEPPSNCGDGVVQGGEECDNGTNNSDTTPSACRLACISARCGDGVTDLNEVCDNAQLNDFEGPCLPTCALADCGDGIVQLSRGEECDDGNNIVDDGCDAACLLEASISCGNGFENSNEECDDGNEVGGDGCSAFCRYEPVQETEPNDALGTATIYIPDVLIAATADDDFDPDSFAFQVLVASIIRIETFDGTGPGSCLDLEAGFDLYDEFGEFIDSDFSSGLGFCGRLELELLPGLYTIQVFPSGFFVNNAPYTVEIDATPLSCGDGIFDPGIGEECDDGNRVFNDGCSPQCVREFCGDNVRQSQLNEECDDGDASNGNGCNAICRIERCGDGIQQPLLGEICDDGNLLNGDGCDFRCQAEVCGNNFIQTTEVCDDGNLLNGDGCNSTCQQEVVALPYRESFDAGRSAFASTSNIANIKWQLDSLRAASPRRSLYMGNPLKRNFDAPGFVPTASAFSPFFVAPATGAIVSFQIFKATDSSSDTLTVFVVDTAGNRLQGLLSITNAFSSFQHFEAVLPSAFVGRTVRIELFFNAGNQSSNNLEGIYLDDFRVAPFDCGNAVVEFGEQCDDFNLTPGDGCSGQCRFEACGNTVVDFNEECDDGNTTNGDGCSSTCKTESAGLCGNGIEDAGEQCDDGNALSGDACSSICRYDVIAETEPNNSATTANGPFFPDVLFLVNDANQSDFFAFVLPRPATVRIETFDDSGLNSCQIVSTSLSLNRLVGTSSFFITFDENSGIGACSRIVIDLAPGTYTVRPSENSAATVYHLEIDADFDTCGDGDLQAQEGEECDDGNNNNEDGCSAECRIERCGDGIIQASSTEECDDGNVINNDACSSICERQDVSLPFVESFDDNVADQFLIVSDGSSVLWQIDNTRAFNAPNSLYFGDIQSQSYENGTSRVQGQAQTPFFIVPANGATLSFRLFQATEGGTTFFDQVSVSLVGNNQDNLGTLFTQSQTTNNTFTLVSVEIPASFAGQPIRVALGFDSKDGFQNNFEGVYIDDLRIDAN
jgi:cysteine-rich repeat protein